MRTFPDFADRELRNWGRWSKSGESPLPKPETHCRSIEHRYMAPYPENDQPRGGYIDVRSAERVEQIWRQLPPQCKEALRVTYPLWPGSHSECARQLRWSFDKFLTIFNQAGWRIADALNGKGNFNG